jgi:ABC-type branched-subunit amino acid transport system substrate-binding protein
VSATEGPRASVSYPGITDSTINLGLYTFQGFSGVADALGFSVATGDQAAAGRAVVDYLNQHGGIAGRKIKLIVHDADATAGDAEPQQACAAWTQDAKAYAVVSPVSVTTDTLYECLAKHGVIMSAGGEVRDDTFYARYANTFYESMDMNVTRIMNTMVDGLSTGGYFGSHPKIAAVIGDTPAERRALAAGLKPALARHGLTLTDSVAVDVNDNGPAYSSAVLKFSTEGITHVVFGFLGSPLLFMINAENQRYYPRYGLNSRSSPGALLQTSAPAAQQRGAMAVGWQPMNDVDGPRDPGILNARQKLCLDILKRSGQDTNVRVTALVGLWICDGFFFLHDALAAAPELSLAGFRLGAESLRSFPAASTFSSGFSPGSSHDGAALYRLLAYKTDCSCYKYVSPPHPSR